MKHECGACGRPWPLKKRAAVVFDREAWRVKIKGAEVYFANRSLLLLFRLAEAQGRIVSTAALTDGISGKDYGALRTAVCITRRRIRPLRIEAVPKAGYRLVGSYAFGRLP